jgi:superfamily II DNA or RNA helicase
MVQLRTRLHLPFALTGAQRRSIAEIEGDMAQAPPMLRLLQGDVGSGKTVVALEAMLLAVEAGAQAALLAPTEILARQHHATLCAHGGGDGRDDRPADRARQGPGARIDPDGAAGRRIPSWSAPMRSSRRR